MNSELVSAKAFTSTEEYIGSIEFSFNTPLRPRWKHASNYALDVTAKVTVYDGPLESKVVGEFRLVVIKLTQILTCDMHIRDICHSVDLDGIYTTLFNDDAIRGGLGLPSFSRDLLLIKGISLNPQFKEISIFDRLLRGVIAGISPQGLVVALREAFDDAEQWRDLGFKEIPRSDLIVRHVVND